jgi:hypothetical protein
LRDIIAISAAGAAERARLHQQPGSCPPTLGGIRDPNGRGTMPWTPDEAERHTHKATTIELKELWAKVANERLQSTGDEARAIREANAVVARQAERS